MKKVLLGTFIGVAAFTLVGGVVALANTGNGFGMFSEGMGKEVMIESKAEILGITPEELEAQLDENTFPQILDEQGITHEELQSQMHEQMQSRMTERLQQMVDEGTITAEQMQEKLDLMEEHHAEGGGRHMMGKGFGGMKMHKSFADENGDGVCDHLDQ